MLELRKAVPEDIDQIWAVRTSAIIVGCVGHYSDDEVQRWANVPMHSSFPQVVAETECYVIAEGSRVVGFGFLDPSTCEICAMFVHPEFQGKGLGQRIVSALETEANRLELNRLWLSSTLNAERFYASAGFKSQGRGQWNHPNGFALDCVKMSKELSR